MIKPYRVGFCVSGGGYLCRAAIRNAATIAIKPAIVIAESKAREDLESFCASHDVPFQRLPRAPRTEFDFVLDRACVDAGVDLLVLTFDRLLPPSTVQRFPGTIINMHPALLPAFPGMRPMQQALASGARFTGATMHEVDEGVDTGPVIAQSVLPLRHDDTVERLGARLFELMRPLYLQVIAWYAAGRVLRNGDGRLSVSRAVYGELPTSPSIELAFAE